MTKISIYKSTCHSICNERAESNCDFEKYIFPEIFTDSIRDDLILNFTCTYFDYCVNKENNTCHADATCTMTGPETYDCTCNSGYSGNGTSCTKIYTDSQTVNVPFGRETVAALVEVTGIAATKDGIASMFDTDNSTFWHGTKLDNELRSAVKLTFTVSYINPRRLNHSYDSKLMTHIFLFRVTLILEELNLLGGVVRKDDIRKFVCIWTM